MAYDRVIDSQNQPAITGILKMIKLQIYRSLLTFPTHQTLGKMTLCQGPLTMMLRSISSVSVGQRKGQSPDEVQLLREGGGEGRNGEQLAYLGSLCDAADDKLDGQGQCEPASVSSP